MKTSGIIITIILFSMEFVFSQQPQLQKAFEKSYELEAAGDMEQAIEILLSAYQSDSYENNLRLGWLHYSNGQFETALAYYQKCIDLLPMSVEAKLGYVLPASALGNWDGVLSQYQAILDIDPGNSKVNYYTGQIYYNRQAYKKAESHFEKIVNLYPFDYDGLLMLAWTKHALGKLGEAKVLFNKVLLYAPNDESAREGLQLIK